MHPKVGVTHLRRSLASSLGGSYYFKRRMLVNAYPQSKTFEFLLRVMMIVTLAARKSTHLSELLDKGRRVMRRLEDYASSHGGRFIVFGSFARGDVRFDSDIDIMIDFPEEGGRDAWFFVERVCRDIGIQSDILLISETNERLTERAKAEGIVLG